jgi:hypothetical protein
MVLDFKALKKLYDRYKTQAKYYSDLIAEYTSINKVGERSNWLEHEINNTANEVAYLKEVLTDHMIESELMRLYNLEHNIK